MATDQFTVKGSLLFSTEGFERAMTRAGKKLKTFGNQATRVGRDLSSAISLPLTIIGAAALKTAASFEFAQKKIEALRGRPVDDLTASARQLGATTIFTAEQVSQLQLSLAKLGKSNETIAAVQGTALQLAQAFDTDLATSGEFLVKTMNRFSDSLSRVGGEAQQASYVANLFAAVTANTALNSEALANALNYVGSEAASYGLKLEDTAAILGLLADRGFDASRGGTALRRVLAQLAKDGFTAEEALFELLDSSKGFSAELERFGLRGAGPAAALSGLKEEFLALRSEIENSSGYLQGFSNVLDTSMEAGLKRVQSAAQEVSIAFATEFSDAINNVTSNVARLLRAFARIPKPIKAVIVGLGAFLAIAGPLTFVIGALSTAMSALALSAGTLSVALGGGLFVAIAAIATGLALTSERTIDITTSIEDLRREATLLKGVSAELAKSEFITQEELLRVVFFEKSIKDITSDTDSWYRLLRTNLGLSLFSKEELSTLNAASYELKKAEERIREVIAAREEAAKIANQSQGDVGVLLRLLSSEGSGEEDEGLAKGNVKQLQLNQLLSDRAKLIEDINRLNENSKKAGTILDINTAERLKTELAEVEKLLKLFGIDLKALDAEAPKGLLSMFKSVFPEVAAINDEFERVKKSTEVLTKNGQDLQRQADEELLSRGSISDKLKEAISTNKTLLDIYGRQLTVLQRQESFTKGMVPQVSSLLATLEDASDEALEKQENQQKRLYQQMLQIKDTAMAIGAVISSSIVSAFFQAAEGTKRFGQALKDNLVSALQRVLTKVLTLIAAFVVLNILSGGAFAASGVGSAASEALGGRNLGQFMVDGLGFGNFRSGDGGLKVQGVLSGSDISLSTKRGVTANDRIYG